MKDGACESVDKSQRSAKSSKSDPRESIVYSFACVDLWNRLIRSVVAGKRPACLGFGNRDTLTGTGAEVECEGQWEGYKS